MALKMFAGRQYSRVIAKGPALTITKYGLVNLNRAAMELAGTGWEHAQFFIDREARELVVKFGVDATATGAHKICKADKGGVRIGAKNFLNWARLDFTETRTFPATYDQAKRMITAKLGGETVTS